MLPANLLLQNRYRIVRPIGQGGMGAVYEAFDQRLAQTVALKQIMSGDATAFEREARLLARLRHPALPHVTDHFVDDNGQFLVMDYIPGDDLATALLRRRTFFPRADVCAWADQLLTTLVYLHSQEPPIVHRDIKPSNLKLTQQNQLILLDFGLAKGHTKLTSEPQKSAAGYTLAYAAPEQIHGAGTDARSDLYAAAATLYHLLTGNRPTDAIQRALLIADGQPDPLWVATSAHHTLSPLLITILQKALALNPANRFADASAMRTAFQAANQTETTQVAEPSVKVTERPPQHAIANNLPARLTSLVGRAEEVAELCRLLARPAVRLVTLTGAGGSGKTSLALAVAHALLSDNDGAAFSDGIYFVNLAPIQEPALVISTVAQVLGVKEEAGKPLLTSLQKVVRHRRLLLVLDNFEQIVIAAPLLSELLTNCATLKLIVTSREVLRVRGEHEFLVPLLALPKLDAQAPADELGQFAAVQLFVERVRALKPAFVLDESNAAAVAEIVTRLDGLPLAIELAASHSKLLSPQAILERLQDRFKLLRSNVRDLPDRQRTLRAAIDWSYDLLTPDEQTLFRRLAVFVGGCTLEAAEEVCNSPTADQLPPLAIDVLDGLASLLDKSLLSQKSGINGEQRFTMLVSIHEYAQARLSKTSEITPLQRQHALYYRALVEHAESELTGAQQSLWLNRLEEEHDNVRAVLHWATAYHEAEVGARVSGSLWRFWERHGHLVEGRRQLEKILSISSRISARWRAKVLHATGNLTRNQGDYQQARAYYREALALRRELNDKRDLVASLHGLGNVAYDLGDYHEAVPILEEALALWQELGNEWGVALEHLVLGEIAWCQANYQRAMSLLQEGLILYEKQKDLWGIAMVHINIGQIWRDQGDYEKAILSLKRGLALLSEIGHKRGIGLALTYIASVEILREQYIEAASLLNESLVLFREQGEKWGTAHIFAYLGQIFTYENNYEIAESNFVESVKLYQETGDKRATAMALHHQARLSLRQNNYPAAINQAQASLALSNQVGNQFGIALALQRLAQIATLQEKFEGAISLEGAAEALREAINVPLTLQEKRESEEFMQIILAHVSMESLKAGWEKGRGFTVPQAIALAMDQEERPTT